MPFTITFVSVPALVLTLALGVWAGRVGRTVFLRRLVVGAIAGLAATAIYDVLRAVIYVATPADFDPFRAHPYFGALMLGVDPSTPQAVAAGWVYHVWNGVSFGVIYSMIAAGRHFAWAVAWAMFLETATLVVYPDAFGLNRRDYAFITVSFLGHFGYGVTLGHLCRTWLGPAAAPGLRLNRPTFWEGFR